ncbi:hypothetical protein [Burkholderia contaminans]|uniref:hypothetical protein n=1 Tax=Burkholderia contaminans TaxID=488447 RepID=UPI002D8037BB|nr:hypothetical protein [Burkholderia contaminans]
MARVGAASGMPSTREGRAGAAIVAPHGSMAHIERAAAGLRIGDDGPAPATWSAPILAGFMRGRTVAGPPVFVPPAAQREMTHDGYRLLVRPRTLRRSIKGSATARFPFEHLEPLPPVMNTGYSGLPCHPESELIRSYPVTIGKKTLHCTLNVCC